MTSAVNPWDTESQPREAHCPARHFCLILFGRMVVPLVLLIDPTNGSISIKLKRPLEARAAEEAIVCSNAGKFHWPASSANWRRSWPQTRLAMLPRSIPKRNEMRATRARHQRADVG